MEDKSDLTEVKIPKQLQETFDILNDDMQAAELLIRDQRHDLLLAHRMFWKKALEHFPDIPWDAERWVYNREEKKFMRKLESPYDLVKEVNELKAQIRATDMMKECFEFGRELGQTERDLTDGDDSDA